jgi:hypothetical protein
MKKRRNSLRVFPDAAGKSSGDGATDVMLLFLRETQTCSTHKQNDVKQ